MIYFVFVWAVLIVIFYAIGFTILNWLKANCFARNGDRFIISIWLGTIASANILLTLSLFLPLSPAIGWGTMVGLAILSLLLTDTRAELKRFRATLTPVTILTVFCLAIAVASIATYKVTWIESGFYHYMATRWLSEYGTVTGIVLLMKNLGIVSSWFALIAPVNGQFVEFRAGAVMNGFIFFVALIHFSICLFYLARNKATLSDKVATSFYVLFLLYTAYSHEMQSIIVSLSPDLAIALLVGIVSWVILAIADRHTKIEKTNAAIVPLLLSIGAVTIKLSALPLLLITCLFFLWQEQFQLRAAIVGLSAILLLLTPIVLVGIQTSGCPLYPATTFCLDLPWRLAIDETKEFASKTSRLDKWYGQPPSNSNAMLWLAFRWLKARELNRIMALLAVLSAFCCFYVLRFAKKEKKYVLIWLLSLAVVGSLFVFLRGPLIRFGLGYFLVLPALTIAIAFDRKFANNIFSVIKFGNPFILKICIFTIVGILIAVGLSREQIRSRLLLPEKQSTPILVRQQNNDFPYFMPKKGACWTAELPCVKKRPNRIRLRDRDRGLQGGFIYANDINS